MSKKKETILFDQLNKVYVMIKLGENKKWQRWVSNNKKDNWVMTHESLSMNEVMIMREKVIANNYNNLYSLIIDKK